MTRTLVSEGRDFLYKKTKNGRTSTYSSARSALDSFGSIGPACPGKIFPPGKQHFALSAVVHVVGSPPLQRSFRCPPTLKRSGGKSSILESALAEKELRFGECHCPPPLPPFPILTTDPPPTQFRHITARPQHLSKERAGPPKAREKKHERRQCSAR